MVDITNLVDTYSVTKGAYEDIFKRQGFKPVKEEEEDKKETVEETKKTDEEAYIEELMEKPISQWNKEEVKTYASLKNVDISNTKNIGEARNIIKQSIDKE
nr:MAG: thymopoietin protein [Bacteriophage sp.]